MHNWSTFLLSSFVLDNLLPPPVRKYAAVVTKMINVGGSGPSKGIEAVSTENPNKQILEDIFLKI